MGVSRAYTLYAVKVDVAGGTGSDILIDQISDFSVDTAVQEALLTADGQVDPTFVAVGTQQPRLSFTTSALHVVLNKCGIGGLKITADADEDGLEAWFQKLDEGGTRAAGASHIKLTIKEGQVLPRTIDAGLTPPATLTLDAIATYDGTNAPILIADSQNLEGSPTVDEVFVAGQVDINGTTLEGVQNITIDFGLAELVLTADGQVWPTFSAIGTRAPSITITTTDVVSLVTFGLTGAAQGATDSLIYLRKVDQGGTRVADNVAEHISFSIDEGRIEVSNTSGDLPVLSTVKITPTFDGSAAIMVIDTATTIA